MSLDASVLALEYVIVHYCSYHRLYFIIIYCSITRMNTTKYICTTAENQS